MNTTGNENAEPDLHHDFNFAFSINSESVENGKWMSASCVKDAVEGQGDVYLVRPSFILCL